MGRVRDSMGMIIQPIRIKGKWEKRRTSYSGNSETHPYKRKSQSMSFKKGEVIDQKRKGWVT